ncbi:MAG: permease [Cytophagales bacterium]|nr:MAG: permease [Cytophagales bacterium]
MKENLTPYYATAISSFVIWGMAALPFKMLEGYISGHILFFRVLSALIVLWGILLIGRRNILREMIKKTPHLLSKEGKKFWGLTIIGGLLLSGNWLSYIYVVNHIDVQTGSFAYLICPILTAVLSWGILKQHLAIHQWAAILLSGVACVMLATNSWLNLLYSLMIAGTYAFYLITQSNWKQYDKIYLLALQLSLAFLVIFPFQSQLGVNYNRLDNYFILVIIFIGIIFTVLPLFLNLYSLKGLSSSTVGILLYINPLINFGIAFGYFHEAANPEKIFAYILIFISVIIYNFPIRRFLFAFINK